MAETLIRFLKRFIQHAPDILYGIAFTGAFLVMCWYLFGVCDLAYVNF